MSGPYVVIHGPRNRPPGRLGLAGNPSSAVPPRTLGQAWCPWGEGLHPTPRPPATTSQANKQDEAMSPLSSDH